MARLCPVCGQTLPKGIDANELNRRIEKIGATAAKREATKIRRELADHYRQQLADKEAIIRKRAINDAQAAEKNALTELRRELESAQEQSEKERVQHADQTAHLQSKIDNLSQQLKHQTPGEIGEMGEADVYAALKAAFPTDDIQRNGKGLRGADIFQKVIVNGKEVGCIVYECKNVSNWQNEWITTAKRYRSEYQTPWIIIATRTFPRGQKWFTVEKSVPVIDFRLTVKLAEIVRDAVAEIGQLRTSQVDRQSKADQMFEYILSDDFAGRFKGFAESVVALRENQGKERQWHSEAWTKQSRLYDQIENDLREIASRMHTIFEVQSKPVLKVVGES